MQSSRARSELGFDVVYSEQNALELSEKFQMIQQPLTGKVKQKIMLEKNYLDANRQQIKEITANMQLTKI